MLSFLALGLIVGMAHALEADHLAAIGTLAAGGKRSRHRMAWLGASWGLGHTTTLVLLSLPVVLLGLVISERVDAGLEFAVGVMLVGLGANVALKMRRQKVHFHLHDHGKGSHFHAHSHESAHVPHAKDTHSHKHGPLFSKRSYMVGLAHGAAGSAGLVALAAAATQSVTTTLSYILIFGFGSTLGMAVLTLAASWPLGRAERLAGGFHKLAKGAMAGATMLIGLAIMAGTGPLVLRVG